MRRWTGRVCNDQPVLAGSPRHMSRAPLSCPLLSAPTLQPCHPPWLGMDQEVVPYERHTQLGLVLQVAALMKALQGSSLWEGGEGRGAAAFGCRLEVKKCSASAANLRKLSYAYTSAILHAPTWSGSPTRSHTRCHRRCWRCGWRRQRARQRRTAPPAAGSRLSWGHSKRPSPGSSTARRGVEGGKEGGGEG